MAEMQRHRLNDVTGVYDFIAHSGGVSASGPADLGRWFLDVPEGGLVPTDVVYIGGEPMNELENRLIYWLGLQGKLTKLV